MKNTIFFFLIILVIISCQKNQKEFGKKITEHSINFNNSRIDWIIKNKPLLKILNSYIEISKPKENRCNLKVMYCIIFQKLECDTGFWLKTLLQLGGIVSNQIEFKGMFFWKEHPIVIIDYINSKGYGIYNPEPLNKDTLNFYNSHYLSECVNTTYPSRYYYCFRKDSFILVEKSEPYTWK